MNVTILFLIVSKSKGGLNSTQMLPIIDDAAAKQNKKRKVTKLSYNRNRNPTNHRSFIHCILIDQFTIKTISSIGF